jgi:hypothetical protein
LLRHLPRSRCSWDQQPAYVHGPVGRVPYFLFPVARTVIPGSQDSATIPGFTQKSPTQREFTRQPLLCCCNGSDRPVLRRCTGHYASIPCWVLPGACGDVCGKRNVPGAAVQKSVRNVQMKHPLTCRVTMALAVASYAALLRTRGSPPTAATAAICRRRRISRRCAWWHRCGLL